MKILLLGKNGQVGWELQRALAPLGELIVLDSKEADFTEPDTVLARIREIRPTVIVNAAAHTAVDKAESEPERARQINAITPGLIAAEAARLNALMVHYSTDYVFDGQGHEGRDEGCATGPLSTYGRTKLAGEQAIVGSGCAHLIFRTSWVYAARGGNFAKTMLRLAAEREELKVIDDQIGAPTGADLIADVTAHALRETWRQPSLQGLYHLVAGGQTSWHAYAQYVIEWARAHGQPIKVAPDAVRPIPTRDYPTPAQRPLNSRLQTQKLQTAFQLRLPHWQQGVERMLIEVTRP
ncbi:MAG: dTDP-4-dehydrorhamnose reductase [Acidobacteriota bacterium]